MEAQLADEQSELNTLRAACDMWITDCKQKDAQIERAKQNTAAAIKQVEELQAALREIGAGNLDGETIAMFANRCVDVAKGALK